MSTISDLVTPQRSKPHKQGNLGTVDAEKRRFQSYFARQAEIDQAVVAINAPGTYGVLVLGPWGAGKTALARGVEAALSGSTHIVKIFGAPSETVTAYGPFSSLVTRLPATALKTPTDIINGIDELLRGDAADRKILVIVDDLPGLDTLSVGVLMHLIMCGTAKLLVLAQELSHLPEDLVWLAKDGMIGGIRLNYFSRAEVGTLIAKATGTLVSESAVTALYNASNGIPLVLQVLFHEQVAKGSIVKHMGGWVLKNPLNTGASSTLAEIVRVRLAGETELVRQGLEKMSLLGNVPLQIAYSVLGGEVLCQLEERGFVVISTEGRQRVTLSEQYVGDIVRDTLTSKRKAELSAQIVPAFSRKLELLDDRETMALAAWTLDAGLLLEPKFSIAAATSAIHCSDPDLALRCTEQFPSGHALWVQAVQARSQAYRQLAEYQLAVDELDAVPDPVIAALSIEEVGSWTLTMTSALLWVPDGRRRIPGLLVTAESRMSQEQDVNPGEVLLRARRLVELARFEFLVHRGDFAVLITDLEVAAQDSDIEYRLNSACLLVPILAVVGRELEAVALGQRIEAEIVERSFTPLFCGYYRNGLAIAQVWSGLWRDCVERLSVEVEDLPLPHCVGLNELHLSLAYTYGGHREEAVPLLMSAAAQLEARNSDNSLELAYSALAFCFSQVNNDAATRNYLALAESVQEITSWTNKAMIRFFKLMALRHLGDPHAPEQLRQLAEQDSAQGRFATASTSLFSGSFQNTEQECALLEDVSLRRQGPLAKIYVLFARSYRTRSANLALEAAEIAEQFQLKAAESRCAGLALELAREDKKSNVARKASQRLERLNQHPPPPVMPQYDAANLTPREMQIVQLAKRGLGNRAIANEAGVSVRTVEGHLYRIYKKLDITTRTALIEN